MNVGLLNKLSSVESRAVLKATKELCKVVVDDTDRLCGS